MIANSPSPVVRYMSILLSKFSLTTEEPTDESLRLMVGNQIFLAPVLDPITEKPGLFEFCRIAQSQLALLCIEQPESLSHGLTGERSGGGQESSP